MYLDRYVIQLQLPLTHTHRAQLRLLARARHGVMVGGGVASE